MSKQRASNKHWNRTHGPGNSGDWIAETLRCRPHVVSILLAQRDWAHLAEWTMKLYLKLLEVAMYAPYVRLLRTRGSLVPSSSGGATMESATTVGCSFRRTISKLFVIPMPSRLAPHPTWRTSSSPYDYTLIEGWISLKKFRQKRVVVHGALPFQAPIQSILIQ